MWVDNITLLLLSHRPTVRSTTPTRTRENSTLNVDAESSDNLVNAPEVSSSHEVEI